METIRYLLRMLVRFVLVWLADVVSLLMMATVVPGIYFAGGGLAYVGATALMLGIVNLVVRPLILLLSLPFGLIAVVIVGLLVNAVMLMITGWLLPFFEVQNWLAAFFGGFVFSAVNAVVTNLIELNDTDSIYQTWVERLAKRDRFADTGQAGTGLILLEIDGLSYWHIQKAIAEGWMPTVKAMIKEDEYRLSRFDCGLPSQTSACQSGIMFGDNHDIPAFRWYDKDAKKLFVSGHDAQLINARYARGEGLMRGGSSINNMMAGDAAKSLLTLATLTTDDSGEQQRRADDMYLLMLNPYFFMRTLVVFFGDVLVELWEAAQQKIHNVQPRLNRLHGFYPLVRAATTVLMREVAAYLAILDIIRGSPAIYVTWPGYDEVAHHSGPWTKDAFRTLRQYDAVIARVRAVIAHKAPRPYELIILSDHGQSFGATFKQRYGIDLKQFIEQFLPQGTRIAQTAGGDDGALSVGALGAELGNVKNQKVGNRIGRSVAGQGQRLAQRSLRERAIQELAADTQVTVCGSGNIAQVYFDLFSRKITLDELAISYPGMVEGLVQHAGVGFVVGYTEDGTPIVMSKNGSRNLKTAEIIGQDPLEPFAQAGVASVELRAEQVLRIASFPHAGDLIVNSTLFGDGTVAAMEELIGSHGGLGGEQTDAFLLHPGAFDVPPTKNSADVFEILNARRGLPPPAPRRGKIVIPEVNAWAPATLIDGLGDFKTWLARAFRALVLDRTAYDEVVADPYMTGPALLILLLASLTSSVVAIDGVDWWGIGASIGVSFVTVLLMFLAGRLLRGKGSFTTTLRGMGFGWTAFIFELLHFLPAISGMGLLLAGILTFVGGWMGGAAAHDLKGWRSFVLPVVAAVVSTTGIILLAALFQGSQITVEALLTTFGLTQAK